MKTLYFDRKTLKGRRNKVCYLDIKKTVDDEFNISKTISVYDKDIQKTDECGNLIYLKNIYETIENKYVMGSEITTEVTDKPYIENVWKTNEDGFKLYSQRIYEENGEPTNDTIETFNHIQVFSWKDKVYYEPTEEIIDEDEEGNPVYKQIEKVYTVPDKFEYNTPIYIDIHAEDEEGNKLYIKDITETKEETIVKEVVETTEKIQIFSYKEESVARIEKKFISCDHVCDEYCTENELGCQHQHSELCNPVYEEKKVIQVIQVPDEFEENKPCMVPVYKDVVVDIFSNPEEFDITELLSKQYEQLLADSTYDNIVADMFINEYDIDFSYENHKANTGAFVCCLHPQGSVQLKEIPLEKSANVFELLEAEIPKGIDIYINDVKLNSNKVKLPQAIDRCIIRFENTTDKYLDIKSYCIAY